GDGSRAASRGGRRAARAGATGCRTRPAPPRWRGACAAATARRPAKGGPPGGRGGRESRGGGRGTGRRAARARVGRRGGVPGGAAKGGGVEGGPGPAVEAQRGGAGAGGFEQDLVGGHVVRAVGDGVGEQADRHDGATG